MGITELFLALLSVGMAVLGWFARTLYEAVQDLKKDLSLLREQIPISYVRKDDYILFQERILDTLTRIEGKLDQKADK